MLTWMLIVIGAVSLVLWKVLHNARAYDKKQLQAKPRGRF